MDTYARQGSTYKPFLCNVIQATNSSVGVPEHELGQHARIVRHAVGHEDADVVVIQIKLNETSERTHGRGVAFTFDDNRRTYRRRSNADELAPIERTTT